MSRYPNYDYAEVTYYHHLKIRVESVKRHFDNHGLRTSKIHGPEGPNQIYTVCVYETPFWRCSELAHETDFFDLERKKKK